jgi:hypothetical protein
MRSITERLALRLSAAAKGDGRFIRRQLEGIALVIDKSEGTLDYKGAVLAATNADIGHFECGVPATAGKLHSEC